MHLKGIKAPDVYKEVSGKFEEALDAVIQPAGEHRLKMPNICCSRLIPCRFEESERRRRNQESGQPGGVNRFHFHPEFRLPNSAAGNTLPSPDQWFYFFLKLHQGMSAMADPVFDCRI